MYNPSSKTALSQSELSDHEDRWRSIWHYEFTSCLNGSVRRAESLVSAWWMGWHVNRKMILLEEVQPKFSHADYWWD
jgi:hypothetical protein